MKRRIGIDANVLVYAHAPSMPYHLEALSLLRSLMSDPDVIAVLTTHTLAEFIHVVADPRRFTPPVTMRQAIEVTQGYLNGANVQCVEVSVDALAFALELMDRHALGRNRVADTVLAATLMLEGVTTLATANARDFAIFKDRLTIVNLLAN